MLTVIFVSCAAVPGMVPSATSARKAGKVIVTFDPIEDCGGCDIKEYVVVTGLGAVLGACGQGGREITVTPPTPGELAICAVNSVGRGQPFPIIATDNCSCTVQ